MAENLPGGRACIFKPVKDSAGAVTPARFRGLGVRATAVPQGTGACALSPTPYGHRRSRHAIRPEKMAVSAMLLDSSAHGCARKRRPAT
jgi:hypothetical protein